MLQGLDDVIPLIEWKASLPINDTNANQHEDTAVDAKQCIVSYFSQSLMWDILHSASGKLNNLLLKEIDTDHNGVISKAELKEYLLSATEGITDTYTDSDETNKIATTNMLVNNLFASIDIDSDGFISIREIFDMSSQHIEDIIFSSIHIKDVLSVEECIELFKKEMKTENLDTNMSACIKDEMVLLATSEFNARLIQAANMIDIDGDGYITREEYAIYLEQHFEEKRDIFKKMNI